MSDIELLEGYIDYLNRVAKSDCAFTTPENDTPMKAMQRAMLQHIIEGERGLPIMSISKWDAYIRTLDLVDELLDTHEGKEDLRFDDLMSGFWGQPNHKSDLPMVAIRLIPAGCLSIEDSARLAELAWTSPEFPVPDEDTLEGWVEVFHYTGYISDNGLERPSKPITLYRGADTDSRGVTGMSWTSAPATAHWFANRFGSEGRTVWVATVERSRVLARFHGRNENEYVIDPYDLETHEYKSSKAGL